MGQYFHIFNIDCIISSPTTKPHFPIKLSQYGYGKLGEFFHNGRTAPTIMVLLAPPTSLRVPDNPLAHLKDEVTSLIVNQEANNLIGLHSLPPELHAQIFKYLTDYFDVLSFSCSSLYLWFTGYPHLTKFLPQFYNYGSWAGDRLACFGDYSKTWPEDVLTQSEKALFDASEESTPYDFLCEYNTHPQGSGVESRITQMSAKRLGYPNSQTIFKLMDRARFFQHDFRLPKIFTPWIDCGSGRATTHSQCCRYQWKRGDTWVLRNITKEEYVRADVLDRPIPGVSSTDNIVDTIPSESDVIPSIPSHLYPWGIHKDYPINLGLAVLSRIISSADPSVSMCVPPDMEDEFVKGKWVGDRFDIVPLSHYQDQILTEDSNWKDVSEEVKSELIALAEGAGWSLDPAKYK